MQPFLFRANLPAQITKLCLGVLLASSWPARAAGLGVFESASDVGRIELKGSAEFLTSKGVKGHPADQNVVLRVMPLAGGKPKVIATLFGGQGTMNVPSWSPDSTQLAFVSYRYILPLANAGKK